MAHIIQPTERQRTCCFIVWRNEGEATEHTWEQVRTVLDRSKVKVACSPLHDSDLYDDEDVQDWEERHKDKDGNIPEHDARGERLVPPEVGSPKPAHWHVLVKYKGNKTLKQMRDAFGELGVSVFYTVDDADVMLRYLAHRGWPNKFQYDLDGVTAFGGYDLSALYGVSRSEQMNAVGELMDCACGVVCDLNPTGVAITNFASLANVAKDSGRPELFEAIYSGANFFGLYLKSLREFPA